MKRYNCDVCGKPFDPKEGHRSESPVFDWGLYGMAQCDRDICPKCLEIGKTVDFREALLRAWREAADVHL